MSNTVLRGGKQGLVVNISTMDSDYDEGEYRPLDSIQFNPGSTGTDVLVVKNGSDSGAVIFIGTADDADDELIKYFHGAEYRPYIDYSACTFSAGHFIMIHYRPA